jgi:hypothetical protein
MTSGRPGGRPAQLSKHDAIRGHEPLRASARDVLHNPRELVVVRIGMVRKAPFLANSSEGVEEIYFRRPISILACASHTHACA